MSPCFFFLFSWFSFSCFYQTHRLFPPPAHRTSTCGCLIVTGLQQNECGTIRLLYFWMGEIKRVCCWRDLHLRQLANKQMRKRIFAHHSVCQCGRKKAHDILGRSRRKRMHRLWSTSHGSSPCPSSNAESWLFRCSPKWRGTPRAACADGPLLKNDNGVCV